MYIDYNLIEKSINNKSVLDKILTSYEVNLIAERLSKNIFNNKYSCTHIADMLILEYNLKVIDDLCINSNNTPFSQSL